MNTAGFMARRRQAASAASSNERTQAEIEEAGELSSFKVAGSKEERLPWETKCVQWRGGFYLTAQLEDERGALELFFRPIWPKDKKNPTESIAPIGETGFATLKVSNNAKTVIRRDPESGRRQLDWSIRPELVDWEPTLLADGTRPRSAERTAEAKDSKAPEVPKASK